MRTYTLWGWTARWSGVSRPIAVTAGSLRDCRARQRQFTSDYDDALCGIYASGDEPEGLALQVQQRIGGE